MGCAAELLSQERRARAAKLGLWADPYYVILGAESLAELLAQQGRFSVVEGKVLSVRESGGTMISSAYKLCAQLIDDHYPPEEWNIYPFHFSDGDNWSMDDTLHCVELLKQKVLPRVNMFAYGQVESPYGSGQFIKDLRELFSKEDRLITSEIRDKDAIVNSIKEFLGKGK